MTKIKSLREAETRINERLPLRTSGRWTLQQFVLAAASAGVIKTQKKVK